MRGRAVGMIGTWRIGVAVARIMLGFGYRMLAHDVQPDPARKALGATYAAVPRLRTFPNVLVTIHQAFFTSEALTATAEITIDNPTAFAKTGRALHDLSTGMAA